MFLNVEAYCSFVYTINVRCQNAPFDLFNVYPISSVTTTLTSICCSINGLKWFVKTVVGKQRAVYKMYSRVSESGRSRCDETFVSEEESQA